MKKREVVCYLNKTVTQYTSFFVELLQLPARTGDCFSGQEMDVVARRFYSLDVRLYKG